MRKKLLSTKEKAYIEVLNIKYPMFKMLSYKKRVKLLRHKLKLLKQEVKYFEHITKTLGKIRKRSDREAKRKSNKPW